MANDTRVESVVFRGGLNLAAPTVELTAGECVQLNNYEVDTLGNYTRILGYERYDGRPSPSEAKTQGIAFAQGVADFAIGSQVTGADSGATGLVCAVSVDSGTTSGSDLAGTVTLYDVTGAFKKNEALEVSGSRVAVSQSLGIYNYGLTEQVANQSRVFARERRRALIQPLDGSGPVLGVVVYKGVVYAFRNSADGSKAHMYKSSPAGWVKVSTPALKPNGRYEFRIANFKGSDGTIELIGVDGVNPAFRFDGSTFSQIKTTQPKDAPTHLECLPSQVLLLAFEGGTVLCSAVGEPEKFSPIDGGGFLMTADEITGLDIQANSSCAIFCRNRNYILYGTSFGEFKLTPLSTSTGAIPWSIQTIGDSIYLDDRGLTRLNRVQSFGNFDMATISQKIQSRLLKYTTSVIASYVVKKKNQYRLCFNDGTGFIVTFNGAEVSGISSFDFNRRVTAACSYEGSDGEEVVFFGSDDGFIYQAERGESFDGEPFDSACRLAFYHYRSPEVKKRFKKLTLQVDTPWQSTLQLVPDFDYSSAEIPAHSPATVIAKGGGGYWDNATWGEFRWSAASVFTTDMYIRGTARTFGLYVFSRSDREPPHTLTSMTVQYQLRSRRR